MIYTNVGDHGGRFADEVDSLIDNCDSVTIASGYVSLDVIEKYASDLERVANAGGKARLLVGMAFYEGLSQKKLTQLITLNGILSSAGNGSGVYIPYARKYHGKIYIFEKNGEEKYFVGSSNFSASGIRLNMEATVQIAEPRTLSSISNYSDFLFSDDVSKTIDQLEIVVPGSNKYRQKLSAQSLDELETYDPSTISTTGLSYFDIDLERYTYNMKSSLNVYFGEGRLNRQTGKITPRSWYELALIATADTIRNPYYPHGNFDAYTDDGYIIPMSTSGDNDKNIQSRGSLKPFGMWLKSRLQNSGALVPLTPITLDTLEAYGRSSIRFYKMAEGQYFMDFGPVDESEPLVGLNEDGEPT